MTQVFKNRRTAVNFQTLVQLSCINKYICKMKIQGNGVFIGCSNTANEQFYSRIEPGDGARRGNCLSKFPGFEKKSLSFGISMPHSTNSVCSSRAVRYNWCLRRMSAMGSKSLESTGRTGCLTSSSGSAIL